MSDLPDHFLLTMPALSPTMERGNLVSWNVKVGDEITAGMVMAEVETDKATVAYESVEEGYLAKIFVQAGTTDVEVGTVVAVVAENKDDVPAFANFTIGAAPPESHTAAAPETTSANFTPPAAAAAPAAPAASAVPDLSKRTLASPAARRVARERGVDVSAIRGTGGGVNRVISQDVLEYTPASGKMILRSTVLGFVSKRVYVLY